MRLLLALDKAWAAGSEPYKVPLVKDALRCLYRPINAWRTAQEDDISTELPATLHYE